MCCFMQTQYLPQVLSFFIIFVLYTIHFSHHGFLHKGSVFFSANICRFHAGFMALHGSFKQTSLALQETSFHTGLLALHGSFRQPFSALGNTFFYPGLLALHGSCKQPLWALEETSLFLDLHGFCKWPLSALEDASFHAGLLDIHGSCEQPFLALEETPFYTVTQNLPLAKCIHILFWQW